MKVFRKTEGGFTLIELVVVISLISLMFFFSLPRLEDSLFSGENNKLSRWIMVKIRSLKEKSFREGRGYTLHIGLDSGLMWATHEGMDEEALLKAEEQGRPLPEGYRILDVAYPGRGRVSLGTAPIRFYRGGYSDKALIHIEDEAGEPISFLIEPFLDKVKRFDAYVDLEG